MWGRLAGTAAVLSIRLAHAGDKDTLVRMGVRFMAESSYRGLVTPDPEVLAILVDHLLARGVIFVLDVDGQVEGMFAAHCFPNHISGELVGTEVAMWLNPERRGGTAWLRLLRAAEAWARDRGAVKFQMIAPAGPVGASVGHLYRRQGYVPLETVHQKSLAA